MKWYIELGLQTLFIVLGALLLSFCDIHEITILYIIIVSITMSIYMISITVLIIYLRERIDKYKQDIDVLIAAGWIFPGMITYLLFTNNWYIFVILYVIAAVLTEIIFNQIKKYVKKKIDEK